jgi:hypothetical protein
VFLNTQKNSELQWDLRISWQWQYTFWSSKLRHLSLVNDWWPTLRKIILSIFKVVVLQCCKNISQGVFAGLKIKKKWSQKASDLRLNKDWHYLWIRQRN